MLKYYSFMSHILVVKLTAAGCYSGFNSPSGAILSLPVRSELLETYSDFYSAFLGSVKIHKTIILPEVLYGCETWSVTLREEQRLRVFENRVLRRIFGPRGMK
jgi:hypothetical protein